MRPDAAAACDAGKVEDLAFPELESIGDKL
jgi:hypothetical protein